MNTALVEEPLQKPYVLLTDYRNRQSFTLEAKVIEQPLECDSLIALTDEHNEVVGWLIELCALQRDGATALSERVIGLSPTGPLH